MRSRSSRAAPIFVNSDSEDERLPDLHDLLKDPDEVVRVVECDERRAEKVRAAEVSSGDVFAFQRHDLL